MSKKVLFLLMVGAVLAVYATNEEPAVSSGPSEQAQELKVRRPTVIQNGHTWCLSKDLFDEMTAASIDENLVHVRYLLENGCIVPHDGLRATVLERGWTGWVKARIFAPSGDGSVVAWGPMEGVSS